MSYDQRFEVLSNIKGIEKVIPQETLDYTDNLLRESLILFYMEMIGKKVLKKKLAKK